MKKVLSKEERLIKRRRRQKGWLIALCVIVCLVLAVVAANLITNATTNGVKNNYEKVGTPDDVKVVKTESGNYEIYVDRDLKIMQLTDVHIGGGFLSGRKDKLALNAIASMITAEKPDLVIITGDISFPVPYIAGTFNNMSSAKLFTNMMDKLGVYYTVTLGNHDSESYSYYNREKMAAFYASDKHEKSLFIDKIDGVDGYGNQMINAKNSNDVITETLYLFDSHSYTDGDYLGINWYYDKIHDNQIEWYKNCVLANNKHNSDTINKLSVANKEELLVQYQIPKSLAFFHIPFEEYKVAYDELKENNFVDTKDTKYIYGVAGEKGQMVYPAKYENQLFETMEELGSTKGVFVGHDHLNNFAYDYKGIQLSYGMSIDYLAYSNIDKCGAQRGNTIITVKTSGEFISILENYYQDKYQPKGNKETVTMNPYYTPSQQLE